MYPDNYRQQEIFRFSEVVLRESNLTTPFLPKKILSGSLIVASMAVSKVTSEIESFLFFFF